MTGSRALLYGYFGQDNFGDDWMLDSFISNTKDKWDKLYVTSGKEELFSLDTQGISIIPVVEKEGIIKNLKALIAIYNQVDVIIFLGGTQWSYSRSYKISRNLFKLALIITARFFGKKVLAIGVGVDEYFRLLDRLVIWLTFSLFHNVSVRDHKSEKFLRKIGIRTTLIGDLSILTANREFKKNKNNYLEKNINDLKIGINLVKSEKWMNPRHFDTLNSCLPETFMYVCTQDDYTLNESRTFRITTDNYLELQQFDLVIASRLHIVKACIYLGVPVVPLEYAPKVSSVASDFSMDWFISKEDLDGQFEIGQLNARIVKSLEFYKCATLDEEKQITLNYLNDLFGRS